ncbi:rRNA adenine methyltransferase [Burkholderia sp. SG-MS1]|uniref:class II aldolase/adducin family protein n=1 Tax=Paraburkholderia sp. SG-MS1 TaxID=2023741 RepID=UPI001447C08A|nr:class II aldolase/adducin family protein [Paraburkholderia sp. SG-MS1]NKJ45631.1 rRNA adenine methyltransferase [Paraburkholderia sp. SG-MS1]
MDTQAAEASEADIDSARWRTRVDLAAAHRLAVMYGMQEGIFNHLTARVPGTSDRYYQIPFGLHWSEVNASSFMEVGYDGKVLAGSGDVEPSAFGIHAPIHQSIAHADAVFHTHMPFAAAMSRLDDSRIRPIGQTELSVMRHLVYDTDYHGPATDTGEGHRLVALLEANPGKTIVAMANHGILTLGSIAHAFDRLYYFERVAQVQLYALWTGEKLKHLNQTVIDRANEGYKSSGGRIGNKTWAEHHFDALKRILDRREPDYRA